MTELALGPAEKASVQAILRAHLPAGARVWAFGSRAGGRVKAFSDLDLAIDAGRGLRAEERAALADAFRESDLPWKVDLVDWWTADAGFRARIGGAMVAIQGQDDRPEA